MDNFEILDKEASLRKAAGFLAQASSELYKANQMEEVIACQVIIDCIQLDYAELVETYFPIVSRR